MKTFALFTCTVLNTNKAQEQKEQAELLENFFLVFVPDHCLYCNPFLLPSFMCCVLLLTKF